MTSRLAKDVSDAEISSMMVPHLERLMRAVVPRFRSEKRAEQGSALLTVRMANGARSSSGERSQDAILSAPEREYLESIPEAPNLTITGRRDYLGLSTYQSNHLKRLLLEKGLIEQFSLNLGRQTGGIIKLLELTAAGYRILGQKQENRRPQNCSAEHWFWQRAIATSFQSLGYPVEVEMALDGIRADVGFLKDGKRIAIEVGITTKNEVANVQRDLAAGFDEVVVACRNLMVRRAIEDRLKDLLSAEQWKQVSLLELCDFWFVKDLFRPLRKGALQRS
jgi:hypothetical protein